jgi:hypothetical protein
MLDKLTYRRVRLIKDYLLVAEMEAEREQLAADGDAEAAERFSAAQAAVRELLIQQAADIRTLEADPHAPLPKKPWSIVTAWIRRAGQLSGLMLKRPFGEEKIRQEINRGMGR